MTEILYKVGFGAQRTSHEVYVIGEEGDGWLASFQYKKQATEWIKDKDDLVIIPSVYPFSLSRALANTRAFLKQIKHQTKADDLLFCFSSNNNFRNNSTTFIKYKGNRENFIRPFHFDSIKNFLLSNYSYVYFKEYNLEADDLLAIYNTIYLKRHEGWKPVIVSQDKDLLQVPGIHLNMDTKNHEKYSKSGELFEIDVVEGNRSLYKQMLTGDIIDNIPGYKHLTGKNLKKSLVEKIDEFDDELDMYWWVCSCYEPYYLEEDIESIVYELGVCLYMKRDWNDTFRLPI